jgi:hypothetical protein
MEDPQCASLRVFLLLVLKRNRLVYGLYSADAEMDKLFLKKAPQKNLAGLSANHW